MLNRDAIIAFAFAETSSFDTDWDDNESVSELLWSQMTDREAIELEKDFV